MSKASLGVYILIIVGASALLLLEPNGFDVRAIIIPLIVLLFLSSLGIVNRITVRSDNKIIAVAGTVALAILLTFIGFFIVASIAWFIALRHAQ